MYRAAFFIAASLAATCLSLAPPPGPASTAEFVDPLPIPHRLRFGKRRAEITVTLSQISMKIHRDLPAAPQWGYDGSSPGPTIEVERGHKLIVHWKNELPAQHIFPLPKGADAIQPDVRAVTHLHGAAVSQSSITDRLHDNDGWPDAWTVPGEEQIAEYPNNQSARTLWYHDHAMGSTGRNVAAGLLGLYEIHDDYERSLNLPSGEFDVPIMIQSRGLNADGTLAYVDDIGTEFYGNAAGVNGKLYPYLDVEPRKYRFRIINVSNARSYGLKLVDQTPVANSAPPPPPFVQIGSDSGFLADPVMLNDPNDPASPRLVLAPAERADVIVDFSAYAGRNFILNNNNRDIGDIEASVPDIMLFRVGQTLSAPDTSSLPKRMLPIPRIPESQARTARRVVFDQMMMPNGELMLTLNGKRWSDPIEETPTLGSTEIWELVDTLTDVHPFHMHEIQFQVLDRRLFDVAHFLDTGQISYIAPAVPPEANEMGWKDTVKVYPQMVTRIIIRFGPYPGYYVYHCHILEHEDMDMMRPFQIAAPSFP